jgi:hypothetical protein
LTLLLPTAENSKEGKIKQRMKKPRKENTKAA